ncbi:MAG: CopD family protein [Pseudomonadota bacterium]
MPDIWGLAGIAAKFAIYLGVLTSAGMVFVSLLFQVAITWRLPMLFAMLALVATAFGFSLGGAALTGDVGGMVDPEMLALLWSTSAGTAVAYRVVGLILLIAGLAFGRSGMWISTLGGGLALWSFTTVGHIPDRGTLWLDGLLLVHLAAIAVWVGVLIPLKRMIDQSYADAADLAVRFGKLASVFVPLLLAAGLVMGFVLVGSVTALVGTGYGQALLLKTAAVAALLTLAALNKMRFVPLLSGGDAAAAQHLSRSISYEWIAVLFILLMTAILTSVLTLPE